MPRRPSRRIRECEPIAARTRLKLGSPIYQAKRVQYPHSWPLLPHAVAYSKQLSPNEDPSVSISNLNVQNVGAIKNNVYTKESIKRRLRREINPESLRIEPCKRRPRQKVGVGKKLPGTQVEFIVIKSNGKLNRQSNKESPKKNENNNRKDKGRKLQRKSKRRLASLKRRRASKKRRENPKSRRKKNKKSCRSVRRKQVASRQRKQRKRKVSKQRRRRRRRRANDDSPERNFGVDTGPPYGHANDGMLRQKNVVPMEEFERVADERRDDPLNINDLCRALVKSLPGIPADLREDNVDDKGSNPNNERPENKINIDKDLERKLKAALERCKPACTQMVNRKRNAKGHRNKASRRRHDAHKTKNKNQNRRLHKRKETKRKCHVENDKKRNKRSMSKTCPSVDNENKTIGNCPVNRENSRKYTSQELKTNESATSHQSSEVNGSERHTKDPKQQKDAKLPSHDFYKHKKLTLTQSKELQASGNIKKKESIKSCQKSVHRPNQLSKREPKPLNRHGQERQRIVTVPYYGRPPPRNRRREEIDIIRHHKKDISQLVKRVSRRKYDRRPDSRRPTNKKQRSKYSEKKKRHQSSSHQHRKVSRRAELSFRGNKDGRGRASRADVRKRKSSSHARSNARHRRLNKASKEDNNGNNNVNNNQTEAGSWGRVSGRLFRIGRFLLRKFQMIFTGY